MSNWIESIEQTNKYLNEISNLKTMISRINQKYTLEIEALKDKIHRRNMQIKDLKKEINKKNLRIEQLQEDINAWIEKYPEAL